MLQIVNCTDGLPFICLKFLYVDITVFYSILQNASLFTIAIFAYDGPFRTSPMRRRARWTTSCTDRASRYRRMTPVRPVPADHPASAVSCATVRSSQAVAPYGASASAVRSTSAAVSTMASTTATANGKPLISFFNHLLTYTVSLQSAECGKPLLQLLLSGQFNHLLTRRLYVSIRL